MNYNSILLLKLIEIFYLIYMFYFFKTTLSIHHSYESTIITFSEFLKHPINSGKYESKICKFGKKVMILLIIYLLIRCFINYPQNLNLIVLLITIIMSFLNMNAVLYIIPFIIIEIYFLLKL